MRGYCPQCSFHHVNGQCCCSGCLTADSFRRCAGTEFFCQQLQWRDVQTCSLAAGCSVPICDCVASDATSLDGEAGCSCTQACRGGQKQLSLVSWVNQRRYGIEQLRCDVSKSFVNVIYELGFHHLYIHVIRAQSQGKASLIVLAIGMTTLAV